MGDNIPGKARSVAIFVGTAPLYRALSGDVLANGFGGFAIDGQAQPLPPLLRLDPSAVALLDLLLLQGGPPSEEQSLDEVRAAVEGMAVLGAPPRAMTVLDREYPAPDGPLPVRVYVPDAGHDETLPVVVYYHGGGFIAGSLAANDATLRALAQDLRALVIAPSYSLAPERPFPAAPNDAYAALQWAAASASDFGGSTAHLTVAGESAGANLAALTAIRARDEGGPHLVAQFLLTPAIDGECRTASRLEFAHAPILDTATAERMWSAYVHGRTGHDVDGACPNRAQSLAGLPPTLIVTAECDPLRDEGEQYGQALREAGVAVTLHRLDGLVHATFSLSGILPRAAEMTTAMAAALAGAMTPAEVAGSRP